MRRPAGWQKLIAATPSARHMAGAFHWIRIKTICYSTEDWDLLRGVMLRLSGLEEVVAEATEGQHGNPMLILDAELTHSREFSAFFERLGGDVVEELLAGLDDRIGDDCVLYARLAKQEAVQGRCALGRGGDVISVIAKVAAHPARKEVAVEAASEFLARVLEGIRAAASRWPAPA